MNPLKRLAFRVLYGEKVYTFKALKRRRSTQGRRRALRQRRGNAVEGTTERPFLPVGYLLDPLKDVRRRWAKVQALFGYGKPGDRDAQ